MVSTAKKGSGSVRHRQPLAVRSPQSAVRGRDRRSRITDHGSRVTGHGSRTRIAVSTAGSWRTGPPRGEIAVRNRCSFLSRGAVAARGIQLRRRLRVSGDVQPCDCEGLTGGPGVHGVAQLSSDWNYRGPDGAPARPWELLACSKEGIDRSAVNSAMQKQNPRPSWNSIGGMRAVRA